MNQKNLYLMIQLTSFLGRMTPSDFPLIAEILLEDFRTGVKHPAVEASAGTSGRIHTTSFHNQFSRPAAAYCCGTLDSKVRLFDCFSWWFSPFRENYFNTVTILLWYHFTVKGKFPDLDQNFIFQEIPHKFVRNSPTWRFIFSQIRPAQTARK